MITKYRATFLGQNYLKLLSILESNNESLLIKQSPSNPNKALLCMHDWYTVDLLYIVEILGYFMLQIFYCFQMRKIEKFSIRNLQPNIVKEIHHLIFEYQT